MPRGPRIDQPGLLQHVMVRGIDRGPIFFDDPDRLFFLEKLALLLADTNTVLLAWALLTNHLHLLIRLAEGRMATLMSRLLTSYAQRINQRYDRTGHLFQNRYKSIVCEEQEYLLELIRYIHLNPLRAGLVQTLDDLDRYPWAGHSVLMGERPMSVQAVEEVLALFGTRLRQARRRYRAFVAEGVPLGRRPELVGIPLPSGQQEGGNHPAGSYVLGSEAFLGRVGGRQSYPVAQRRSPPLEVLHMRVAEQFSLPPESLLAKGRMNTRSEARAIFCWMAVIEMGYPASVVGRYLGITGTNVSRAAQKGAALAGKHPLLASRIRP